MRSRLSARAGRYVPFVVAGLARTRPAPDRTIRLVFGMKLQPGLFGSDEQIAHAHDRGAVQMDGIGPREFELEHEDETARS
jgi:hypothetical protein